MKIITSIETFNDKNPVVTVGTFDGVHKGHKKILNTLVSEAEQLNGTPVVFTFKPHPRKVLFPNQTDLAMLNTDREKIQKLKEAGVAVLIEYPFSIEFANYTSCEFIENILYKKLKIKTLIMGYDHRFGKDRQGDYDMLKACALSYGFKLIKVDAYKENGREISSTKIRKALEAGDIQAAGQCLGYDYSIQGKVIAGNKIGRTIGFPTANIEIDNQEKLIPRTGVYAVDVLLKKHIYKGMLNIGKRPTFSNQNQISLEVNLFDFNENIYKQSLTLFFKHFIREEQKFASVQALQNQLKKDKDFIISLK